MLDIALAWGLTTGAGTLLKPVVEELVTDATKDWFKDMFKGSLSNALKLPQKEPLEKCAKKAIGQFLNEFTEQLQDADCGDARVKEYVKPLKKFLKIKQVRETLGNPLQSEVKTLDIQLLAKLWQTDNLQELPDDFDWSRLGKRYVRRVKEIITEDEELRQIFDSENLARLAEGKEITTDFSLRKHRETIQERYQNLPLDGLDHSIQDRRLPLWDVFIMQSVRQCQEYLPKIYELPKEYQDKLRQCGQLVEEETQERIKELEKVYSAQVSKSISEIIETKKENNYLVILGDPGSGKSTLLKYLALKWTQLSLKELTIKSIPLLIELRDYAQSLANKDCANFLEFIHKSPNWVGHLDRHELHENLNRGNALVMFDGLDEVFDIQQRKTIIKQIHDLTQDYPQIQVIVTSRVIGYDNRALRDANFEHYMIQDFDEIQIEEFSEKWHSLVSDNQQDKQKYQQKLKESITNSKAIRQLAGNPLLLTMMAILNRSQELPRDRAELYHQCSRILLYQWDVNRALTEDSRIDAKTFDYKDKQAMCRQIAYFMQSKEQGLAGNIISENDLEKLLRSYLKSVDVDKPREIAKVMIHQLRHRNFMLCSLGVIGQEGHYGFVHRTFLEYFCAWAFVWRFKEEQTLSIEDLITEVFAKHWQDETWHEVLRLICSMIEPKFAGEIIEYLMSLNGEKEYYINLLLAADCLGEVRNRKEIEATYFYLLEQLKKLFDDCQNSVEFMQKASRWYQNNSSKQFNIFWYVDFKRQQLIRQILEKISNIWNDSSLIKDLISYDKNDRVTKSYAIECLAKYFHSDLDTISIFENIIKSNQNSFLVQKAIENMAEYLKHNFYTLDFLVDIAVYDDNKKLFSNNQEFAKAIEKSPKYQQHNWVKSFSNRRATAIIQLTKYFSSNSKVKKTIKNIAINDRDSYVRTKAIQELLKHFADDYDLFDILSQCAKKIHDDDYSWDINQVRRTALQLLVKLFPDRPQLKELLLDRLENDPDEQVRKYVESVIDRI